MKLILIGSARHGKDTVAEILQKKFNLNFTSSSIEAARIFLFDELKDKYKYKDFYECFEDRVNHRKEWYDKICAYNKEEPARLATEIFKSSSIYVGMRSGIELTRCKELNLVDYIVGVYNPRIPEESPDSFDINMWKESDFIIPNAGTLQDLEGKVTKLFSNLLLGFHTNRLN